MDPKESDNNLDEKAEEQVEQTTISKFRPMIVIGVASAVIMVLVVILFVAGAMLPQGQEDLAPIVQDPAGTTPLTVEDKTALLTQPTPETENDYDKFVEANAVASSVLIVGVNCDMSPLVIKITPGTDLTIKNEDIYIHTIEFEDQDAFSVSPGRERVINIADRFKKEDGVYRYNCSESESDENVGVMYIVQ